MPLLTPPDAVVELVATLEKAGFETWCVGGAVRDALLGRPGLDWDLATAARPEQVQRVFRRTIPVGLQFGTVGVLDRDRRLHEVTTFRTDVETDGRHAVVEFGATLEEDLARRDLTINAIAYSPLRDELRDPFGGRADLEGRIVRAVGDPRARLHEDRLRALRAMRFAARYGFTIEPATWAAIVESAPHLVRLSPERVQQELTKTMEQAPHAGRALRLWRDSGALAALVPALAAVDDVTLATLDCLRGPSGTRRAERRSARVLARLTALFLPLAPAEARTALRALRFSNAELQWVTTLVERWHLVEPAMTEAARAGQGTDGAVRRWAAAAGRTRTAPLVRLVAARWAALASLGAEAPPPSAARSLYRRAVRAAFGDPIELADLAVDGDDLRAAGVPAGRRLGMILQALLGWVVDDPRRNARDLLLDEARRLAALDEADPGDRR
jgi:tRNA nucleotidyltransferase (CCA-adding enzyme)